MASFIGSAGASSMSVISSSPAPHIPPFSLPFYPVGRVLSPQIPPEEDIEVLLRGLPSLSSKGSRPFRGKKPDNRPHRYIRVRRSLVCPPDRSSRSGRTGNVPAVNASRGIYTCNRNTGKPIAQRRGEGLGRLIIPWQQGGMKAFGLHPTLSCHGERNGSGSILVSRIRCSPQKFLPLPRIGKRGQGGNG